ncbi:MAG: lytic transglycosylase domain-containing protein [Coriobacteriia bacterium]|nr:lytic transglycosylase domain-containing protein [Coriobacteriia bacterium]
MSGERVMAPRRWRFSRLVLIALVLFLVFIGAQVAWERVTHPLRYRDTIAEASVRFDVDPYLVVALINAESGFDAEEVSSAGAVGLMQLLPSTAAELAMEISVEGEVDEQRLKEPELNIELGTRHLADLLARYGHTRTALAAYNAGGGNVDGWLEESGETSVGVSLPFPETEAYVQRVLSEVERYRELYPTAFEGR